MDGWLTASDLAARMAPARVIVLNDQGQIIAQEVFDAPGRSDGRERR